MRMQAYLGLVLLAVILSQCQNNSSGKSKDREMQGNRTQNLMFSTAPAESKVSGEYMRAFLVAHNAFERDSEIPEEKRRIENYNVEFRQDTETYLISFFAKRIPPGSMVVGGETEMGKDVTYAISKGDYQLIGRQFYK